MDRTDEDGAAFHVASAESRHAGADIPGAAADGRRIADLAITPDPTTPTVYMRCRWCDVLWRMASPDDETALDRHEASCTQRVGCPECGVLPHQRCTTGTQSSASSHAARCRLSKVGT